MNITVRELQQSDKEQFDRLYKQITQEDFPEWSSRITSYFVSEDQTEKYFSLPIRYGVFDGEILVGYALGNSPIGGVFFLDWLAVSSSHRGKGVGSLLLSKVDEFARQHNLHNIHLRCDARNLKFYQSNGYVEFGLDKKGYFGTDDYLMKKVLGEPNEDGFGLA